MMKERKKLVFRAMACLTLMTVVLLIGPEVYAAGSGVTELDNAAEKTMNQIKHSDARFSSKKIF